MMPKTRTSFQPGWKGGPGRPKGSKNNLSRMRQAIIEATTEEEIEAVVRSIVYAARPRQDKNGNVILPDLAAVRLYLDMVVGKPVQQIDLQIIVDDYEPPLTGPEAWRRMR